MVELFQPVTLAEALSIRHDRSVMPFAGGTDLMVRKKSWAGTDPSFDQPVLYLGNIPELKTIELKGNILVIGAAAALADLLEHRSVPGILKSAVSKMASPSIRNLATVGGNLCNASPAADTAPVLYAAGAVVEVRSISGIREMEIGAFILGPGRTALAGDELLTSIQIPLTDFNLSEYRKVGTRKANALAKLSFVGQARIFESIVADVRIAFGAVAPTVVRSQALEQLLYGCPAAKIMEKAEEIREGYARLITPIDDQRSTSPYRKTVALRLLADFLNQMAESAF